MAEAPEIDPIRAERMRHERRLYHDFLSLNYRVFEKYCRIREIFGPNSIFGPRTPAERLREQRRLEEVNRMLVELSTMILSLEKNSESLLFSD